MAAMRTYAAQHGFTNCVEVQDDVSGAMPIRDRKGGAKLYKLIDARATDAVIFYTVDRVTRDEDLIEINMLRRDVRNAGMELHYVADGGKTDLSTWGGVVDTLKAAGAAEERKKIVERNMRGRMAKAMAGKWVGEGQPPFGYRKIGKGREARLEIDDAQADTVGRIYALYLGTPDRNALSMGRLQDLLHSEGVPTPKGGGYWCKRTLQVILTQPAYLGRFQYRGVEIQLPGLAIIAPATADAVRQRMTFNRAHHHRARVNDYLLTSRIRCTCGRMMSGRVKRGKYLYYVCSSMFLPAHVRTCHEPHVSANALDAQVWDWLTQLLSDDAQIAAGLDALIARSAANAEPLQERLDGLDAQIDRTERKIKRLVTAYGDADEHVLAALRAEAKLASKSLTTLKADRAQVARAIAAAKPPAERRAEMLAMVTALRGELLDADIETRRYALAEMGVSCEVSRRADGEYMARVSCALAGDTVVTKTTDPRNSSQHDHNFTAEFPTLTARQRQRLKRSPAPI